MSKPKQKTATDEKTPASLREFKLLVTDRKGIQFPASVLKEIGEEQEFIEDRELGDEMPEDMVFRIQKRGQVYDHLKMAISIMEAPAPNKQGVTRKEGKTIDSLLDKLYEAEEAAKRPAAVLLDEGEWKHLRDRAEEHPFPNRNRATRKFQDNVIDETEKVPVAKVGSKAASAEE